MKRFFSIIITLCVLVLPFAGCASGNSAGGTGKLKIVATVFPQYDWLKNLTNGAENIDLTLLLDSGTDLHSYQPAAEDMITISTCDLFVYVGGESDSWVEDALKEAVNPGLRAVSLMKVLGSEVREEETVEGMQTEQSDDRDEPEYDEHVWLSLRNAEKICDSLTDTLCEIDGANAETYKSNGEKYKSELDALDKKFVSMVDGSKYGAVLFGDRFPFRYLTDDYKLSCYAAFAGCSAETEASFETVHFLSEKLKELNLPAVLTLEKSDKKIAETVIEASKRKDVEVLTVDSMQSVVAEDIDSGASYLSIMEKNFDAFTKALN